MVDTRDLKSLAGNSIPVRVRSPAPGKNNPNQIFLIGDGFGLFVFSEKFEDAYFKTAPVMIPAIHALHANFFLI